MTDTTITKFFGDRERAFRLTPGMLLELERVSGAGIGSLCKRLFAGEFAHRDVTETLRLAMIGGGEAPETASALVATYAADRPLAETYPLAVAILEALWFGTAGKTDDLADAMADEDQAMSDSLEGGLS